MLNMVEVLKFSCARDVTNYTSAVQDSESMLTEIGIIPKNASVARSTARTLFVTFVLIERGCKLLHYCHSQSFVVVPANFESLMFL
jgi:hypothetical protein